MGPRQRSDGQGHACLQGQFPDTAIHTAGLLALSPTCKTTGT